LGLAQDTRRFQNIRRTAFLQICKKKSENFAVHIKTYMAFITRYFHLPPLHAQRAVFYAGFTRFAGFTI
jgi:hypothetical protein